MAIGGAAGLSAVLASTPSLAQEPAVEEVVVTGSRIRQNPLEERLPVLSVSADDYAASGATSTITIEPASTEYLYVPVYDPRVCYGELALPGV